MRLNKSYAGHSEVALVERAEDIREAWLLQVYGFLIS